MARRTKWEDTLVQQSIANGGSAMQTLMGNVTPNESEGETLTRCIGELSLFAVAAGAFGVQRIDLGIGIASQEAFAAGVVSDPTTADEEPSRGWVYRQRCVVAQNGAGMNPIYRCTFDIRAQRKIDGAELFITFDNRDETGTTFLVAVSGLVRCLFLLP